MENVENVTRKKQPKIDRELVISKFNSGMKPITIAKELNTSRGSISNILKEFWLTTSLEDIKIDVVKVLRLHAEGFSNPKIAELLECSRVNVFHVIKKNGLVGHIAPRPKKEKVV
jgi:transcriptional regulator